MRHSRALAILVLLLLLLRIGSASACVQHELADLGMGTPGKALVDKPADAAGADGVAMHASCTHCNCHHAAAVLMAIATPAAIANTSVLGDRFDEHASAPLPLTLRPPIA
ncbi:hypothetical protein LYSHEL_29340 [Lysobacter helvus]|uniref:DUF2946 domain-containing protein n=2 Tax=Lysobacteraceae TaxID=32033 RepID=A0ABN6FW05_9GAMM|nr:MULTISPECIES: hypothetical protein [Lysobacter]BCT93907.1 hypothetical protein LYSCAS_29310 [Lysobacter caseinilyticus]BCT97063.1 hypothetical protein LYSHEL_29340 [Lysobacter helvus]